MKAAAVEISGILKGCVMIVRLKNVNLSDPHEWRALLELCERLSRERDGAT